MMCAGMSLVSHAHVENPAAGQGTGPQQVASGLVVQRVHLGLIHAFHHRPHQCFLEAQLDQRSRVPVEIALKDMGNDVHAPVCRLGCGEAVGQFRIGKGYLGEQVLVPQADLLVKLFVFDDSNAVELRARGSDSHDGDNRQSPSNDPLFLEEVPDITVVDSPCGDRLGGVQDAASPQADDCLDVSGPADLDSFIAGRQARVGQDAADLEDFEALFAQQSDHSLVEPAGSGACPAKSEQHPLSIGFGDLPDPAENSLSEYQASRIDILEPLHHSRRIATFPGRSKLTAVCCLVCPVFLDSW